MTTTRLPGPRPPETFLEHHPLIGVAATVVILIVIGSAFGGLTGVVLSRVIKTLLAQLGAGP